MLWRVLVLNCCMMCIAQLCCVLFLCSSVGGHWGCFYSLAIVNTVALNIGVQDFVWTNVFISLGHAHRHGIARSRGNSMFNLLKKYQTVFQSVCTVLQS